MGLLNILINSHKAVKLIKNFFLFEQGFTTHNSALAPYTILCSSYIESVSAPSSPCLMFNEWERKYFRSAEK